jgi:hypothetical protein
VQIDERDTVTFNQVYGGGWPQLEIDVETYTDAGTYVGADSDPLFDQDDELVFMARDAGAAAPGGGSLPAGVVAGSGVRLAVRDSLDGGEGFVYLFQSDGSLEPHAEADYVSYSFDLDAGVYPDDYDLMNGPNPEASSAVTSLYETEFTDRWIRPVTKVKAGAASGVDILDRHKNMFAPDNCGRTENTFSNGEGAFFANIDGPVRAIRSYMGANSGPLTQRRHLFYEGRQDIATFLRVHAISGVMDVYDYSPDAIGMTYANSINPDGVSIDGVPDSVTAGVPDWEMATGAQGALIIVGILDTDIDPLAVTSYYNDDSTPIPTQCFPSLQPAHRNADRLLRGARSDGGGRGGTRPSGGHAPRCHRHRLPALSGGAGPLAAGTALPRRPGGRPRHPRPPEAIARPAGVEKRASLLAQEEPPMAYYRAQIDVRRPIDDVFAYLADFSNTEKWDPGVVSAKKRGKGPVAVGTQFKVVSKFLGHELPLVYRIVQCDPPNRVVLEAENDNLRSVDTITFKKTARGTRLTYDANLTLKGIRYVSDFALHLAFQWIGRRALEGLQAALE